MQLKSIHDGSFMSPIGQDRLLDLFLSLEVSESFVLGKEQSLNRVNSHPFCSYFITLRKSPDYSFVAVAVSVTSLYGCIVAHMHTPVLTQYV